MSGALAPVCVCVCVSTEHAGIWRLVGGVPCSVYVSVSVGASNIGYTFVDVLRLCACACVQPCMCDTNVWIFF